MGHTGDRITDWVMVRQAAPGGHESKSTRARPGGAQQAENLGGLPWLPQKLFGGLPGSMFFT
jgi:hypothetical protein